MVSNYSGSLDPIQQDQTYDPTLRQDTRPGQPADASQRSKLGQMWDAWTSHPENNAAMINFGLQLMQPIQAGQSRLGHFAQAVGAGAEGLQRNVAGQEERQKYEEAQALKEREEARKEEETSLYGEAVRNRNQTDRVGLNQLLQGQRKWQSWLTSREVPEDIMKPGQAQDPVVSYIQSLDPRWAKYKTKAEVIRDPGAAAAAERYVKYGPGGQGAQPQAAGSDQYPEGTVIKNPTTGERQIKRDGVWTPLP